MKTPYIPLSAQVGGLVLDAAALDELWDGLDRVDSHFWQEESFRRYMESGREPPPATKLKPR